MRSIFTALLLVVFSTITFSQNLNVSFVSQVNYAQELSDIWGYVAPDGTEYAIIGLFDGVSIVNLSDPANPVEADFVPGVNSGWRDIKTWDEYAYVINETGDGLAVIDLTNLPGEVTSFNWEPDLPNLGTLVDCHNIWIDENGYAYLVGCNLNNGGLLIVDVFTTPGQPEFVGAGFPEYSHDVYVEDNLAYSCEIGAGQFAVYDVTDKTDAQLINTQSSPAFQTHNAWLSTDGLTLFITDETGNAPVTSYDVSDLNDIKELDQFRPLETLGEGVIPHNVHVWENYLIVSYYTDGCLLIDATRPDNLIEVGNFDTYIPADTGFEGAWGAYPYLPSGLILVSDIGDGLFVLEPNYVQACYLEGKITDANTGLGIPAATADMVGELAFETSDLTGEYKTGIATAGTYDVTFTKAGYTPKTISTELENGVLTNLDVALEPLPSFQFTGQVRDAATGDAIPNAKVLVQNNDFKYNTDADASGNFVIASMFEGNYDVFAGSWGYKTNLVSGGDFSEVNNSAVVELETGIEDVFSLDLGWEISGNATQGIFEIGNPFGIELAIPTGTLVIQPGDDRPEDIGDHCFVTGNSADIESGVLIGGTTKIASPIFDISTMQEPKLSYYTWFFNINPDAGFPPPPGDDALVIKLSNGIDTVVIQEVIDESFFDEQVWYFQEINILDTLEATANMQITFEINDTDFDDLSEALVDYFRVWDANPSGTQSIVAENYDLSAFPNPSAEAFSIQYNIKNWQGTAQLVVYNLLGQAIENIVLENPEGKLEIGNELEQGVYFVQIQQAGELSASLKVVKQ